MKTALLAISLAIFLPVVTQAAITKAFVASPPRPLVRMTDDERAVYREELKNIERFLNSIHNTFPHTSRIIHFIVIYKNWAVVEWENVTTDPRELADPHGGPSVYKIVNAKWELLYSDVGDYDARFLKTLGMPSKIARKIMTSVEAHWKRLYP